MDSRRGTKAKKRQVQLNGSLSLTQNDIQLFERLAEIKTSAKQLALFNLTRYLAQYGSYLATATALVYDQHDFASLAEKYHVIVEHETARNAHAFLAMISAMRFAIECHKYGSFLFFHVVFKVNLFSE
jgi:ribosomal protein S24E